MERTIQLSGDVLSLLLYAFRLAALLLGLLFVVLPLDSPVSFLFAFPLASLASASVIGLWQSMTDSDGGEHLGTAEDITHDPFAAPGQAAKERWERAVRRLPDDDEQD